MAIAGKYLYGAAGRAGIQIVDVSRPASLVLAGVYLSATAGVLASAGQYAYVVDGQELRVVDVTNPAAPIVVGSHTFELNEDCNSHFISDIAVSDEYAYLTITNSGLHILNVSQPTFLHETGFLSISARQIAVAGGYAYMVDGLDGLHVANIAHPSAPTEISSLQFQAGSASLKALSVAAAGKYVYVGADFGSDAGAFIPSRLHIVDASNPAQPHEVGSLDAPDLVLDIAVAGNYAYLATALSGLQIVDISNQTAPVEVGGIYTDDWATSVAVDGKYAYITVRDIGLIAIDITNPMAPVQIDVYNTPNAATAVAAADGMIYANNGGGLAILHVLNLAHRTYLPLMDRQARS